MDLPDHGLPEQHLSWGAEALWHELEPLLPGLSLEVLARIDSTNSRLLERFRSVAERRAPRSSGDTRPAELHGRRTTDAEPCLLVAEHQTRGRGRQGRTWVSSAGASLTFSLALPLEPADWMGLSLAVGVALADALDPPRPAAPRLLLKWPNDILIADDSGAPAAAQKIAGILVETMPLAQRRVAVIGVGIDVQPQGTPEAPWGRASLQPLWPGITPPQALARVARPLVEAVLRFEREGFAPFAPAYARRDLLAGHGVTTSSAQWPEGVAEGVDESGALLLRVGADQHRVISADVSLRLRAATGT